MITKNLTVKLINLKKFFLRDFDFIIFNTVWKSFQDILKCLDTEKCNSGKPPVLKVSQLTELNKIAKSKNLDFFVFIKIGKQSS